MQRIEIIEPEKNGILDDGLAVFFSQGQSYTGEEVVELQLHGGRFLLQRVLQLLISTEKCRMALPGEFSFRAVRNGKLSLAGAEAVGQLISAQSLFEVQAARRNLGKSRCQEFEALAAKLRHLLAQSELSIDFIDQDVEIISLQAMKDEISGLATAMERLLTQMRAAQRIARGLSVTLVGAPNAGKSTLFNALLAEDRAIVSPEAGTTRDIITEELRLGPYFIRLADTAGLRTGIGDIEKEGISRARDLAADSDAVILVVDGTRPLEPVARSLRQNIIVALNKCDLLSPAMSDEYVKIAGISSEATVIPVSAARGVGIDALMNAIRAMLDAQFGSGIESFLPTEFQLQMLVASRGSLAQVEQLLNTVGLAQPELISAALGTSVRALSDLVGETTPDTVLAKIFSEFCIGK
ncbi:MAG: tRNA uridine-5-carboxymethylaminomethyl(34) synthesis GTPase MnmE [Deltaproteobacteria bacterium]|nr:tRNA uridine-5-carboxymethylaminomethyl(34) synthesis GTPase MnmE [Deltaproteobacteria bacterium]